MSSSVSQSRSNVGSYSQGVEKSNKVKTIDTTVYASCVSGQLAFNSKIAGLVGPGLTYLIGLITNTSSTECSIGGVPSIAEVNMQGSPTTSFSVDGGLAARLSQLSAISQQVELVPLGSASFYYEIGTCPNYDPALAKTGPILLEVTIPGLVGGSVQLSQEFSVADGCRIEPLLEMSSIQPGVITQIPDLSYVNSG